MPEYWNKGEWKTKEEVFQYLDNKYGKLIEAFRKQEAPLLFLKTIRLIEKPEWFSKNNPRFPNLFNQGLPLNLLREWQLKRW